MKLNRLSVAAILGVGLFAVSAMAQDGTIKGDVKEAGTATGHAAKKTGRKIKHGTKKVVNKSASGVEKGADKVKEKTQ